MGIPAGIYRRIARITAVSVVALGSIALTPSAHAAGYGCAGNLIDTYYAKAYPGGAVFGYFYLYYDASTGRNCGVTVANSAGGYGTPKYMRAEIDVCASTVPGDACQSVVTYDNDAGTYSNYAGPVSVKAAGRCIAIFGQINYAGKIAQAESLAAHCG
ncbi:hypothetical protein ACF061_36000 [Streptomyces sp. NPDC015220]|uniref:hypothetical protein n=1 Tax=Streptomyces sp. NPDC015220 TaxID=3364947 RepID=UPI0036FC672C